MGSLTDGRRPAVLRVVRGGMAAVLVACLLASCGGGDQQGSDAAPKTSASPTSPAAPTSAPTSGPPGDPTATSSGQVGPTVPSAPASRNTELLARQLDDAIAVVRDPDATEPEIQRAGEFQQLAARTLARSSDTFRSRVLARVRPVTAQVTRGDVRAARLLMSMTAPQPTLPRWRIVAPPPREELLGYYRQAQRRIGVHWTYLAAIHLVETRMGRIRGVSTAGARGPMQFLPPTWERYGAGGDINDPRDAILAAARLLRSNGAPGDMAGALWRYNPSDRYVGAVTEYARTMQQTGWTYRGYWHWRVLYRHVQGTVVLPVGYPKVRPTRVAR